MTTLAVVKKNGVAAIAADTLTKWGTTKESASYVVNHGKLIQVGDSWLAVTGYTTFILILKDYFADPEVPSDFQSVSSIFRSWQALHTTLKEQYFLLPGEDKDDDIESSQMDVLIANPHGIFGVSEHRSVQEFSKFYAYGSGSDLAMGAMHALYNSQLPAEEIARRAIEAAAEFDDRTGLPVEVRTVQLLGA
jgi:ATP-dependent protease HslVU (ClpYQ), peptidase subunit